MASREQLETALKNAHRAGDEQAARRLARAIQSGEFDQGQQPAQESGPSFMDRVGDVFTGNLRKTPEMENIPELTSSGLLSGENQLKAAAISPALLTTTDPEEIVQIVQSNFPNVGVTYNRDAQGNTYPILVNNKTGAAAIVNKPGISGIDVLQGLGIGAAYTPAGKAGTVASMAGKSAAVETGLQAAQAASGGEFDESEVLLSAGLGGGLKAAEGLIGTGYRAARGKLQGASGDLVRQADDLGIPLMTSDAMPPRTFVGKSAQQISEKIPVAGTGATREGQQTFREAAVDQFTDRYNSFSYETIVDSLKRQKSRIKKAAGSVLENTGNKLDDVGEIGLDNTRGAIARVKDILDKPGVLKTESSLDDLQKLVSVLDEAPQSFTTLKENRTAFRNIVDSIDPQVRSQLTSREKALMKRVESAMTEDMKDFARKNLSAREFSQWNRANQVYAEQVDQLKNTRLKSVLDKGDLTPEVVDNLMFSRKPSEVASLYRSLTPEGRKNAKSAIISKVVDNVSRRQSGLTPNSFATELKKYGPQTDIFFRGEDRKYIDGLQAVLGATRRAQDAAVSTPTGQQLIALGTGGAFIADPIATLAAGGLTGGTARLYESAPVRNALIRLGSVPKGSTQFEKALRDAVQAVSVAAQTARSESSESEASRQLGPEAGGSQTELPAQ